MKKEKVKKYVVKYRCQNCKRLIKRKFTEAPHGRVIMPPEETKCKCGALAKIATFE